MTPLRDSHAPIVVAGAGIGGLAAALCLARAGQEVLVLERAPRIEEVGAGLQIAPNAGRILQAFGLGAALDVALLPQAINIRRARDGARLARLDLKAAGETYGAPFRLFHRGDLQQLLLHAARRNDLISIRTNARIGDFDAEDGAVCLRVQGEHGLEDVEAAALVAADGARSGLRSRLCRAKNDAPRYAGHTAWRAILPADAAPAFARRREVNFWFARDAHVVHYPLRDGDIVNGVVIVEDASAREPDGPPTLAGPDLLREAQLETCAQELRDFIAAAPEWRRWPLYLRPALPRWSYGAVTLLGDAAHPMLPFLAQGAAQALEDAAALGRAFQSGAAPARAFELYEKDRRARATRVQKASTRQGQYYHFGAPLDAARDFFVTRLGGDSLLKRNDWIYR